MTSLRKLAKHLDLSHATVSAALRGLPSVKACTRERVLRAAEEFGYQINPLASALMASMRRVENQAFRGVLILLRPEGPRVLHDPEEQDRGRIAHGAVQRARELGFDLQEIQVGGKGHDPEKLHDILVARGVPGLLMLASPGEREAWRRIDRDLIPSVCAGVPVTGLDFVGADHEAAMALALRHVNADGRRRVGLALARHESMERHRASIAAFYASQISETGAPAAGGAPSLLICDDSEEEAFHGWLEAGDLDAVIVDAALPRSWQQHLRELFGESDAVCFLNLRGPCGWAPGVDLRWENVGRKSVDLLADHILLRKAGRAAHSITTTLCRPGWVGVPEAAMLVA